MIPKRTVKAWCGFFSLAAVVSVGLTGVEFGGYRGGGQEFFTITVEDWGVGASEVERTLTNPLEAAVSRLPGVRSLRSVSEPGKALVIVGLGPGTDPGAFASDLAESVHRTWASFPRSAQRPRIDQGDSTARPVWVAALEGPDVPDSRFQEWVYQEARPDFETLPGVCTVEIAGGQTMEVLVSVDGSKAAAAGLGIPSVARALQDRGSMSGAGVLGTNDRHQSVSVSSRWESLEDLAGTYVPVPDGEILVLSSLATVEMVPREPREVTRLDGKERLLLAVYPTGAANLGLLSRALSERLDHWKKKGLGGWVILDEGHTLNVDLAKAVAALVFLGTVMAVYFWFEVRRVRTVLVGLGVLTLGLTATFTFAGVVGVVLDPLLLGVLSGGLVPATEVLVLVSRSELVPRQKGWADLGVSMAAGLLVLGGAAWGSGGPCPGTSVLVIGFQWTVTLGLILYLFPVLTTGFSSILSGRPGRRPVVRIAIVLGAVLGALVVQGIGPRPHETLTARVEFPSGTALGTVDQRVAFLGQELRQHPGVLLVQTRAWTGAGEILVRWDRTVLNEEDLRTAMDTVSRGIPGASLHIEGRTQSETRLLISGDDPEILKASARALARSLAESAGNPRVTLNFKEPVRTLTLQLDSGRLPVAGILAAEAVHDFGWALSGPVAAKWIFGGQEFDVRVRASGIPDRASLLDLPLRSPGGAVAVSSVGTLVEGPGDPKIYHEARRRAVSLSVEAVPGPLKGVLERISLPPGYDLSIQDPMEGPRRPVNGPNLGMVLALVLVFFLISVRLGNPGKALVLGMVLLPGIGLGWTVGILAGTPVEILGPGVALAVGVSVRAGLTGPVTGALGLVGGILRRRSSKLWEKSR